MRDRAEGDSLAVISHRGQGGRVLSAVTSEIVNCHLREGIAVSKPVSSR